jgi:pyrimidine oxygenase
VTHHGRFFDLDDCQSWPKPVQETLPIVCATSSDRGFAFVAERCDEGFFGGSTLEAKKATSHRMKAVAAAAGRAIKTHTLVMLIQGDSDDDAQRMLKHYQAGADHEAIENVYRLRARDRTATQLAPMMERFESDTRLFYGGVPFVGGPERVADMIEELGVEGEVDGVMFVFPDFIAGLTRFGDQVMPLLRQRGILAGEAAVLARPDALLQPSVLTH